MLTPRQKYEVCRVKSGVALIPFFDTLNIILRFSTRNGNAVVNWGDGTETIVTPQYNVDYTGEGLFLNTTTKTYGTIYNGDVSVLFRLGLRDVYSMYVGNPEIYNVENQTKTNIQDFGAFIKQFPNLYSYIIDIYNYQITSRMPIIKGNLIDVPDSVERILIGSTNILNAATDLAVNLNGLSPTSRLKWFYRRNPGGTLYNLRLLGDIAKIPLSCTYFKFEVPAAGSSITYTAGKVWANTFDTLSIPLPLSHTELDSLLTDMNNSITTKTGDGVISIGGYRSAASDSVVASLQAKGFTVNILIGYQILNLPFQNSFTDSGEMAMTMVAGGTSNQPTFALSGRKAGEYCAVFNGSQSIKTTTNLPINSDKVTVAFWMKTDSSATSIITELSADVNTNNAFSVASNSGNVKNLNVTSRVTTFNQSRIDNNSLHGNIWNHVSVVIDRSQNGANEILIYVNGVLATFTKPISNDNNGNFVNNILFIGQRGGSSLGFNGSLTKLKIYNYPFTPSGVSNLYNSEL